jgi:hypothetical protein
VLSDRVRGDEYDFTIEAMDALQSVPWAVPLIRVAQAHDLLTAENKPLMFEVRFAFELHCAGVIAQYEYPTGIGGSSVDFRIPGSPEWLIEIVSIRAGDAVKRATCQTGIVYEFQMSTSDSNARQRPEGELIRGFCQLSRQHGQNRVFLHLQPPIFTRATVSHPALKSQFGAKADRTPWVT